MAGYRVHLSYRTGLTIALLLLAVLPAAAGAFFFAHLLDTAVHDEFNRQARQAGDGVRSEITRRLALLTAQAEKCAADATVRSALAAGDRQTLARRLEELYRLSTLDLLEAGDRDGHVRARGHQPGDYGEDKSVQRIIVAALAGTPAADIESGVSGIALRAVAPVRSASGDLCGTLMTGVRLNADFLARYRAITGLHLVLYQDTVPIAHTGALPHVAPAQFPAPPSVLTAGGRWHYFLPLLHTDGTPFGGLLIWQDAAAFSPESPAYRQAFALVLACGLLLAILFALLFGRTFSAPLRALLAAMDRAAAEPAPVNLPGSRWREFAELAAHFTAMLARLQHSHVAAERAQRQLLTASKLAVIGRVTAELAHEIRNPLNAMEITLRVLKDRLPPDAPECGEKVELVRAEIRRLNQTLRDFIEAGGEPVLRLQSLDAAAETREALRLLHPQIESLGLTLREELAAAPPVRLDRIRFHQAVRNLVLNACQSMKAGGILTVRGAVAGGTRYELQITDTGGGMTAEEQQKLFDFPFSTRSDGHGFGLAYVMRLVQAHGGEFDLHSAPGRGTTVSMRLPLAG